MLTFIEMEFLKLKRSNIFLLSLIGAILPPLLMFIAVFAFDEGHTFELLFSNVNMYMSALFAILLYAIMISMFLVWILILTVVTTLSTMVLGFVAGLDGFSLKLFIDSFAQLLFANVLLFLTFSPFVFISLFITNMVPAMVGGAGLALVNMMIYGQTWAPYVPWVCPYLIASGEIAEYSSSITLSYAVILATFAIGLVISYIYFTKTDVSL